jgi:hypothetical protein
MSQQQDEADLKGRGQQSLRRFFDRLAMFVNPFLLGSVCSARRISFNSTTRAVTADAGLHPLSSFGTNSGSSL